MNEQELRELKATVARLEAAVKQTNTGGGESLARARRIQRRAMWVGAAGLCALPMVGWAAVELTTFVKDDPISSSAMNTNFGNVNSALDGPLVRADQPVGSWTSNNPVAVPVVNAELNITTTGGLVHVQLFPETDGVDGEPARVTVEGIVNQSLRLGCFLERSADEGATWETRAWITTQDSQASGTIWLSPSVVAFVDDPPAGEWRYRLAAAPEVNATAVGMTNVRLYAREFASGG